MEEMRAGADRAYQAAAFADDAVQRLTADAGRPGIFGDFDAAHRFGGALSVAHSNHQQALRGHVGGLGALADAAQTTASAFTAMEQRNAAALRAAQ